MGPTHVLLGAATAYFAAEALHAAPLAQVTVVTAAAASSRLPDVDMALPVRHRGPTHRFAVCWVVAALAAAAGALALGPLWPAVAGGVLIGYGMHLVADRMTITGLEGAWVPHLLPEGFRFRTGGLGERALTLAVLAGFVLYLARYA